VPKTIYRKLKAIGEEQELEETLQNSIISHLKIKHRELEKQISKLVRKDQHALHAKNKTLLVPSKIKHFAIEFDKDEFYKLSRLLNDIEKEVKNGIIQ